MAQENDGLIEDGEMWPLGRDIRDIHSKLLLSGFWVASGGPEAVTYQAPSGNPDERVTFTLRLSNLAVSTIVRSVETGGWDEPPAVEEVRSIQLQWVSPEAKPTSSPAP